MVHRNQDPATENISNNRIDRLMRKKKEFDRNCDVVVCCHSSSSDAEQRALENAAAENV